MQTPSTPAADRVLRRGFTLVELLVVISVVGLLMALLLPAVQAARETARRVSCSNNLRQIGLGLVAYHETYRTFPTGCTEPRLFVRGGRQLAWSALLLPFLEQEPLYDQLDLAKAFDAPENAPAAAAVLSVYLCPGNARDSFQIKGRGVCDYGGIFGQQLVGSGAWADGVMLYDDPIAVEEIPDGASHTLIVSEDCNSPDMQWINGLNVFEQAFPINQAPPGENEICSQHAGGGANAALCDGAVRFLPESLDRALLGALCTREGGEVVDEF